MHDLRCKSFYVITADIFGTADRTRLHCYFVRPGDAAESLSRTESPAYALENWRCKRCHRIADKGTLPPRNAADARSSVGFSRDQPSVAVSETREDVQARIFEEGYSFEVVGGS